MMKGIDVYCIKLFLRIDLEKNNGSLLRDGNFEVVSVNINGKYYQKI